VTNDKQEDLARIAKVMANRGVCSRRDAEKLIFEGRVKVDGVVITTPACKVTSQQEIMVDDELTVPQEPPRLWLYYKNVGLLTTHRDPQGRDTVFDGLPQDMPRVISVGRLDINSEGLLLLTNSGEVARYFELPVSEMVREYKVRVYGTLDLEKLRVLEKGITIDGMYYKPIKLRLISQLKKNSWLQIELKEGKNREIRKLLEHFGLQVSRLIRVSYGPFSLGDLEPGEIEEVDPDFLADFLK
jgi:23S rRNA pseudouridine2605 synthase